MELYEIKKILSENGNVALGKASLEQPEVMKFFEEIHAKIVEACKDKHGETHVAIVTAVYQLDDNDVKEAKRTRKKDKFANTRREYNKVLDDMKRKQKEALKNGGN